MRGFSIFIWCLVTALMFYSAWRFKAPDIEADVTARVTDQVQTAGGTNVEVDVDGRHVNLRGFAANADQKTDLLETADNTYGALGPIDGLMLPQAPARTFLSAARTQTGVVLSGVVGSDTEREMLLTQAKSAGLGNITDDLTVAQGKMDWTDAAQTGFAQLAALEDGHLYVSGDRQALSGTAPSTEIAATAAALGGNWQSFVSGPALEDPRIAELTGTLDERNTQLNTLGNQIADRDDQINKLNGELTGVRADLEMGQAKLAETDERLSQRNAHIALLTRDTKSKSLNLADLGQEADSRAAKIAELEAQLAANSSDKTAMEAKLAASAASLALLRNNGGEQTAGLEAALAEKTDEVSSLEAELVALNTSKNSNIADLDAQVANLTSQNETAGRTISDLNAQVVTLSDEKARLSDRLGAQNVRLNALDRTLVNETAAKDARISELDAQTTALSDENSRLASRLGAQDVRLRAIDRTLVSETTSRDTVISDLQSQLDAAQSNASKTDALRLEAVSRGNDLDAIVADQTTQLANLTVERDTLKAELSDFEAARLQVGTLTATVSQKDEKIAALMASLEDQPAAAEPQTAAVCNETAQALLSEGKINFVTNSADIIESSEPLLERITGVVLACSGPETDANVTIAGHTDSRGSEASNQALSEARAQSVANFMIARGVDENVLQSIGLGEAEPIADNETTEGRALNRRISFDFQSR